MHFFEFTKFNGEKIRINWCITIEVFGIREKKVALEKGIADDWWNMLSLPFY
jgi:hypothetical protein